MARMRTVVVLMVLVCLLLEVRGQPKKKKKKAPKKRVAAIGYNSKVHFTNVKDLEKNVTALWGKVDMLSQPVHVHLHGDSYLMDHHEHHDYDVHHDDHDHDHDHHHHHNDSSEKEEEGGEKGVPAEEGMQADAMPRMKHMGMMKRGGHKHGRHHGDDGDGHRMGKRGHKSHGRKHGDHGDEDDHDHDHDHDHGHGHERGRSHHDHDHHDDKHHPKGHKHDHHDHDHDHDHEEEEHHHEEDHEHMHHGGTHVHIHLHTGGMGHHDHHDHHDHQALSPVPPKEYRYAVCEMVPNSGVPSSRSIQGNIMFRQMPDEPLELKVRIRGFPIDRRAAENVRYLRGMHGHQFGDASENCARQGGHYNPQGIDHGGPKAEHDHRHPGDFGNLVLERDGTVNTSFNDTEASLFGVFSLFGRGVVIHAGADDLGLQADPGSKKSGNAGARVACCAVVACPEPSGVWQ